MLLYCPDSHSRLCWTHWIVCGVAIAHKNKREWMKHIKCNKSDDAETFVSWKKVKVQNHGQNLTNLLEFVYCVFCCKTSFIRSVLSQEQKNIKNGANANLCHWAKLVLSKNWWRSGGHQMSFMKDEKHINPGAVHFQFCQRLTRGAVMKRKNYDL